MTFRVVRCMPNGSCFQIAARLGIEVLEIEKRLELNQDLPTTTILDGQHDEVVSSAEDLRSMICEWQHRGLQTEVPQLGHQDASNQRFFTRGDLLALEKVRHGDDVPEKGAARLHCIRQVLSEMRRERSWASTPEQIALAALAKCNVNIQARAKEGLRLCDRVAWTETETSISLLFHNSHQDLLMPLQVVGALRNSRIKIENMCSENECIDSDPKKDA